MGNYRGVIVDVLHLNTEHLDIDSTRSNGTKLQLL